MILRIHPLAVLLMVSSLVGCTDDVVSSRHQTRADAADIVDRGWIPAVLPDSARDIRESHNLDSNVGHGTFVFGATDADAFKAALVPIPADHPAKAESRSTLQRSGYLLYSFEDFEIAVNWTERKGEFWLGRQQ